MKYNCKKLSVLFAAVMMFVLACPVTVLAAAEEEDVYKRQPDPRS